ncbi:hypothetical protein GCM10011506_44660 [Marivirga lumbricoides]|uniref:Protein SirB1 N-terminal domain-containing protein n=1 Tax=Marivirga lumbricoides TaxID=1046115 RepID=A0ABQ1N4K5_9BACT|nr:hypothetical protein GCM10011506_44660 [Marivirga lumbricoides]
MNSLPGSDKNNYEKLAVIDIESLEQTPQWNKLITKLEKKRDSDTEYFLDYLFYKTHQILLKKYTKHTDFESMISSGSYDCVSGSIAYSLLLSFFNIEHSIIETDYHVFIVARAEGRDYIFESTDPISGFIKNEEAVIKHIAQFKPTPTPPSVQNTIEIGAENYQTTEGNTIYKEVSIEQLIGLQYYNQGISAINNKDFNLAKMKVSQALTLYPSERIKSVLDLIIDLEKPEN